MKRQRLITLVLILFPLALGWAGSILSSYGPGLYYRFASARTMGMGGANIAFNDPFSVSRFNPAANVRLSYTTLMLQFVYEGTNTSDGEAKANTGYANLDGFTFAVPIRRNTSFQFSLQPWTRMNYHLAFENTLEGNEYTKRIQGEGGINSLEAGLAWAPIPSVSLGLTVHYLFGRLKETWRVDYSGSDFEDTADTYSTKNNGFAFTWGLLVHPTQRLSLGAVYTTKGQLDNTTHYYTTFNTTGQSVDGELTMPSNLGFGAQYLLTKTFRIVGDYEIQKWSDFDITYRKKLATADVKRFAFGFEYLPSTEPMARFFKKVTYRAGFTTQPFFGYDLERDSIRETWFTLGAGIPFYMNASQIDIGLGIGRRGSLDKNGLKENLIRLTLSWTGGERWFLRRY